MAYLRLPRSTLLLGLLAIAGLAGCQGSLAHRPLQPDIAADAHQPSLENPSTYLELIRQMQQQGAYFASLAHIQSYRQHFGDPPPLRLLEADAWRETGQLERARQAYRSLTGGTQAAAAWHGLGLIAAAQQQSELAEQALARASTLEPINPAYLGDLGFARLQAGELAAAREPLAKAAELAPDQPKSIANLALWTVLDGHPEQAEAMMRQGRLPDASIEAVWKLAAQWRQAHASTASSGQTAAGAPAATQGRQALAALPGNMLERFGNPGQESHP